MPIALVLAAASLSTPIPTPTIFVAGDYALTFRAPPNTTTCALPADWAGSNHGTVVFLQPPKECGGVSYPSSSRSFSEDVARIEVFYAYWIGGQDLRISVSARYTTAIANVATGRANDPSTSAKYQCK